ncbi:MAG: hypothetical protein NZ901_11530 [Geminocystis sp.]|nr:hypothetical protein [Geminocystis sp.]MCS7148802.1 hypothetical protein [Geminocystis sp.]MDW8115360.1 hypothetical protein [Geminocystis sp.]MDW8462902.1 hypothetical protein [Geminocystis sp.]
MLLKTASGLGITADELAREISEVAAQFVKFNFSCEILEENNCNVLFISLYEYHQEDLPTIVDLIVQVIRRRQILDNFIIRDFHRPDLVHFYSFEEDNRRLFSSSNYSKKKDYVFSIKLENFSGILVFTLGLFSLLTVGISYYFTRPCVLGDCALIEETDIDFLLNRVNNKEFSREEIETLKREIVARIKYLQAIPPWSRYHGKAEKIIGKYRSYIESLELFEKANLSANYARNMTLNPPLSLTEWKSVQQYWQQAVDYLNQIDIPQLQEVKNRKIAECQKQLELVETQIDAEEKAEKTLATAKKLASEAEALQGNVDNLLKLKKLESKWKRAIAHLQSIPLNTSASREGNELFSDYQQKLKGVQAIIRREESAQNYKKMVEQKSKLAKKSETENQWSQAVKYWQDALAISEKIPAESWEKQAIQAWKKEAEKQLQKARSQLKIAVTREEIKRELHTICQGTENICQYLVENNYVKIYLTPEYLKKISSLSEMGGMMGNGLQDSRIINHINQVEKNYQYISAKYGVYVEVYNPQQELIMIYSPP